MNTQTKKKTDLIWYIRNSVHRFHIVQDPNFFETSSQQRIRSSARYMLAVKMSAPAPCYIKK